MSVVKMQVGLLGTARDLQQDLNRMANKLDTSTSRGLHYLLQETVLALQRNPQYAAYGARQYRSLLLAVLSLHSCCIPAHQSDTDAVLCTSSKVMFNTHEHQRLPVPSQYRPLRKQPTARPIMLQVRQTYRRRAASTMRRTSSIRRQWKSAASLSVRR